MHKDFLMPGEKSRCFASTSLPLSMPPTLSFLPNPDENTMYHNFDELQLPAMSETFEVTIQRNSLGLGLSIMGGPDAGPPLKHFIRVKKLFPLQPAWQTGMIQPGDILLKADQKMLTGLTLRQALDVLRCSPPVTTLLVCRPLPEFFVTRPDGASVDDYYQEAEMSKISSKVLRSYSYTPATRQLSLSMPNADRNDVNRDVEMETSDANRYFMSTPEPEKMQGNNGNFLNTNYNNDLDIFSPIAIQNNNNLNSGSGPDVGQNSHYYGEFTIVLRKVNGSLGFTLYSQTDDSTVLRHSVKALVKEPALSDGRIRAGDKLVAANDIECGHLSHQELIQFLRKCPEEVTLRFYRDASRSQTPVSTPQQPIAPVLSDNPPKKSIFFLNEKNQKFANFFASSSSHPDLAFTSLQSQSSKPKQLRAEAKEMVRSLQASRSSLENGAGGGGPEMLTKNGSNASGGGSRRKIRPFSPARDRPQPNPICLSASAPSPFPKHLVAASGDSLSTSPVQSPTVESPMTPAGSNSDFGKSSLQYYSINDEEMIAGVGRLQIEELPTNEAFAGKSSFSSYSSSSAGSDYLRYCDPTNSNFEEKFERPTQLDLFGSGSRKQQGYIFNK